MRWERVKVSDSRTLTKKKRIGVGTWGRKGGLHSEGVQVSRRRVMGPIGEVGESMIG